MRASRHAVVLAAASLSPSDLSDVLFKAEGRVDMMQIELAYHLKKTHISGEGWTDPQAVDSRLAAYNRIGSELAVLPND